MKGRLFGTLVDMLEVPYQPLAEVLSAHLRAELGDLVVATSATRDDVMKALAARTEIRMSGGGHFVPDFAILQHMGDLKCGVIQHLHHNAGNGQFFHDKLSDQRRGCGSCTDDSATDARRSATGRTHGRDTQNKLSCGTRAAGTKIRRTAARQPSPWLAHWPKWPRTSRSRPSSGGCRICGGQRRQASASRRCTGHACLCSRQRGAPRNVCVRSRRRPIHQVARRVPRLRHQSAAGAEGARASSAPGRAPASDVGTPGRDVGLPGPGQRLSVSRRARGGE